MLTRLWIIKSLASLGLALITLDGACANRGVDFISENGDYGNGGKSKAICL
jgi:hypothetical protein